MAGRRTRGARPHPPRSQHFLRSTTLAAELVRAAEIGPSDLVLEIGAGRGRLTEELARAAGTVRAIEVDPRLARALSGRWPNVEVIAGDAASIALPTDPYRVLSNLPFHRTTDLMHLLLDDPLGVLIRADLIVEWNVAVKRARPWPSSLNGVYWSAYWEARLERRLPRAAFAPRPPVDAGLLVYERRRTPLVEPRSALTYRRFLARGFRAGLREITDPRVRASLGRERAPRDLDAHEWASLFNASRGTNQRPDGKDRA